MRPPFAMPTTVRDMADRWNALDLAKEGIEVMQATQRELVEYNQRRLRVGIGTDDKLLPRYLDDPYFETPKQAIVYGKYKKSIGSQAPLGIMDFYINGYTHNRIGVVFQAKTFTFITQVDWGQDIQRKTAGRAFGISPNDLTDYRRTLFNQLLVARIKARTGAN